MKSTGMTYAGFGDPIILTLWVVSTLFILLWYLKELVNRRFVALPSYIVFFIFFFPIILQYPFAFSKINESATGNEAYLKYIKFIDIALVISVIGMMAFVVGYHLSRKKRKEYLPIRLISISIRTWMQPTFIMLSSMFFISLFLVMFKLGLFGLGGVREEAMRSPTLRPIYNIAHTMLPPFMSMTLLVGVERRKKWILGLFLIAFLFGVLTGTRSVAFGGILVYILTILTYKSARKMIHLRYFLSVVVFAFLLLFLAIYLGDVREGRYNPSDTLSEIGVKIFYGNNFSDLRDFAWLLSNWDSAFLYGKTYLAGFVSFVPSSMSSFRRQWNWGSFSTHITGLNSDEHPGLRAGVFGEVFFNFGIIGVLIGGLLFGYITRRLNEHILYVAEQKNEYHAKIEILAGFIVSSLSSSLLVTAGFFGFYLIVACTLVLYIIGSTARLIQYNRTHTD